MRALRATRGSALGLTARLTLALALGAAALLLAGCAGTVVPPGATERPASPTASPFAEITCDPAAAGSAATRAPVGFDPVVVVRCNGFAQHDDVRGTWSGTQLTSFEGDLEPLLTALAAPDAPRTSGACSAIGFAGPILWLGDGADRFVPVAYPVDECGMPRTDAVFAALSTLTVAGEEFRPRDLVDSSAARAAGCPSTGQMLKALGTPASTPRLPAPGPLTVCRYEAESMPSEAPEASSSAPAFVDARTLDAAAARAVLAAASTATPAPACGAEASRIVALVPAAAHDHPIIVELDGCRHFSDLDYRAFDVPDALIVLLKG